MGEHPENPQVFHSGRRFSDCRKPEPVHSCIDFYENFRVVLFARRKVCSSYTSGRAAISRASPKSSQKPSIAISPFIPFSLNFPPRTPTPRQIFATAFFKSFRDFRRAVSVRVRFHDGKHVVAFSFYRFKVFFSRDKSTSARHLSTLSPDDFFNI